MICFLIFLPSPLLTSLVSPKCYFNKSALKDIDIFSYIIEYFLSLPFDGELFPIRHEQIVEYLIDEISFIGHHHELQCGHAFCEQCLLVTQEYTTSKCPDCEVSFLIFHVEYILM